MLEHPQIPAADPSIGLTPMDPAEASYLRADSEAGILDAITSPFNLLPGSTGMMDPLVNDR